MIRFKRKDQWSFRFFAQKLHRFFTHFLPRID